MNRNVRSRIEDDSSNKDSHQEQINLLSPPAHKYFTKSNGASGICPVQAYPNYHVFMIKLMVAFFVLSTVINNISYFENSADSPTSSSSKSLRSENMLLDTEFDSPEDAGTENRNQQQDVDEGDGNKEYISHLFQVHDNIDDADPVMEYLMEEQKHEIEIMMQQMQQQQEIINKQLLSRNEHNQKQLEKMHTANYENNLSIEGRKNSIKEMQEQLNQKLEEQRQWLETKQNSIGRSPVELSAPVTATPGDASHEAVPVQGVEVPESNVDVDTDTPPGDVAIYPNAYKDTWELLEENDMPVFWHIAKSGGSTIKDIMGSCHQMCLADESGIQEGHPEDAQIDLVRLGGDPAAGQEPRCFVNVDTTKTWGIERAVKMGLMQSGLADGIVIRHLFEANDMFDSSHRGRLFALFRDPIERAVSLFSYLQYADWELNYKPELATMTIERYAKSPFVENNSMVRFLLGDHKMTGPVTEEHLEIAKDIVGRKFLVGLLDKKEESMERFEKFFGWKYSVNPGFQEPCREKLLVEGANPNKKKMKPPEPGTEAFLQLVHQNKYDIQLYRYIQRVFEEQEEHFKDKADGFRLEGATCCECPPLTCQL